MQGYAVKVFEDAQARATAEGLSVEDRPLDRWRVAPFVTEWCDSINPGSTDGTFAQGTQQVRNWHVSTLSNGNFQGAVAAYPGGEQSAFMQANTMAGYRYGVQRVDASAAADRLTLEVRWNNTGVAPTYTDWRITYSLHDAQGRSVATADSTSNLRTLLGDGAARTDSATLDTRSLPRGTYNLHVRVTDPTGARGDMRLTSGEHLADGSHRLGSVRIG